MNEQIEKTLAAMRLKSSRYAKTERYYDGDHDLAFATEKFANTFGTLFREFALNLCPVICDAIRDKLQIDGFSVDDASDTQAGSLRSDTRSIWHRNRMASRAGEIHKEVLKNGDAYVIVWPNARGEAVFYANRAQQVDVVYDDEDPGRIVSAAKLWRDADKHIRLNLFYPDRIERYISRKPVEGALPDAKDLLPLRSSQSAAVLTNPFGVVPVFHFANNADLAQLGRSEMEAAIPVQDGLNKSVLDMLVAMEFSAYRQRWAAGIEIDYDNDGKVVAPFKAGIDHLWITGNPDAKFGDFAAAELEQFLKVKDSFRVDIASVTGTPLHYLLQSRGDYPSGESLRRSETRFIAKVRDRQKNFGRVWADVMEFALKIKGHAPCRLITEWEDPSPISERERLENLVLKKQLGVADEQILTEAGYGLVDIDRMRNGDGDPSQNRER